MKKLLLFSFILSTYALVAQSPPSDHLLLKMEEASDQDQHELVFTLYTQLQALNPPDSILLEGLYYQCYHAVEAKKVELAKQSYHSLLSKIALLDGKASPLYSSQLERYMIMLHKAGQHDKAVEFYEKELASIKDNKQVLEHAYITFSYGGYYESIGAMVYAIRYYKEALEYVKQSSAQTGRIHILILHSLARVLEIQHRYDQAESLYKEALQMDKAILDEEERSILVNDFGMLYFFTRQYQKALPYFESIKKLIAEEKIDLEFSTSTLANLADCYAHLGRYQEAEALYIYVEKFERTILGESHYSYPTTISRMGDLYAFQQRNEKAKTFHLRAIELAKEYLLPQDLYLFYNMEQAYLFFEKTTDWQQVQSIALDCFERNCMDAIPASGLLKNIQKIAKKHTFATMPYALKSLKIASKSYWEQYKIDKDKIKLQQAYELQLATRTLLNRLKNSFSTEWDKLELLATTQEISELGILISQELYEKTNDLKYQNSAFEFLENNKYVLLQEALQSKEANIFGDVPQQIIQKEESLNQAFLIARTNKIAADSDSKQKAIEEYNRVLSEIDQFKANLQTQYPTYYQYKYAIERTSISMVQSQLQASTFLIEYFIGKEQVYLYAISSKEVHYKVLPISNSKIQTQVRGLRKVLSNYQYILKNKNIATQQYQELAYWFYQELVLPALESIQEEKHLIIIPDGLLGHLPFEAFLTTAPNQVKQLQQLDFLIKTYKISYAYSSNLLLNPSTPKQHNQSILAMGASYNPSATESAPNRSADLLKIRKKLIPLGGITKELNALEPIIQGQYYYGADANEKTFKQEASQYAILHLAMHGILNETHPILSSLAFTENLDPTEDNFLQAFEISQMKLNAELVVLSACETGYGKFKQGEGVMSLARSFMYAGVPSMVVSMWQVNDGSTSIIMSEFYKNLEEGMDKAEALQEAKLYYIKIATEITAHPAFWAPFIQLGDSTPIQLQQSSNTLFWMLGSIGAVLLLVFFWSLRRNKDIA